MDPMGTAALTPRRTTYVGVLKGSLDIRVGGRRSRVQLAKAEREEQEKIVDGPVSGHIALVLLDAMLHVLDPIMNMPVELTTHLSRCHFGEGNLFSLRADDHTSHLLIPSIVVPHQGGKKIWRT